MKTLAVLLLWSSYALAAAPAESSAMKVSDLNAFCSSGNEPAETACRFYIFGAFQGLHLASLAAQDNKHFCLPEDTHQSDMVKLVRNALTLDLAKFPQDKDLDAIGFIAAVLQRSYPCTSA